MSDCRSKCTQWLRSADSTIERSLLLVNLDRPINILDLEEYIESAERSY